MLKELIKSGFGKDKNLNCAEKILYGANKIYNLGLNKESLKLSAGFGGGMGIESTCGALTGAVMVLSRLLVKDTAHNSNVREYTKKLLEEYKKEMGFIDCDKLKEKYRSEITGCDRVIIKTAELLDKITKEIK